MQSVVIPFYLSEREFKIRGILCAGIQWMFQSIIHGKKEKRAGIDDEGFEKTKTVQSQKKNSTDSINT